MNKGVIIDEFGISHGGWIETIFTLEKAFSVVSNHHQLLNEYLLHNFFAFLPKIIIKSN